MEYKDIIEIDSAKERFMGNYSFFAKYLYQFPDRSLFGDLKEQLAAKDAAKAFETAHTMKGVVANLSLKKMEKELLPIVETLRAGDLPKEEEQEALEDAYRETVACIEAMQAEETVLF